MVRRVWKDRIVERPRTYEKIENPDGTITLTPSPGQVIQEGTPVNAENMNNIEQGIEDTQARVDTVQQDLAAHKADKIYQGEVHGMKFVNEKLQVFNGKEWIELKGGGKPVNITRNISATGEDKQVLLNWTDPDDVVVDGNVVAKWKNTNIVRKEGSPPLNEEDGVLVAKSGVRNQYEVTSFVDRGVQNGIEYFYGIFPESEDEIVTVSEKEIISATPTEAKIYGVEIDENNSNPKSAVTYTDDAVGFIPASGNNGNFTWGSWENIIKDEFEIRPVVLQNLGNKNATVNYGLQYDDYTKKADGSNSNLAGTDGDVMIEFGVPLWWKFTRIGSKLRIQLSNKEFDGAIKPAFEIEKGYNLVPIYPLFLTQIIYLLMFKNLDSQTALGRGRADFSSTNYGTTGRSNTDTFNYGETGGLTHMKFLGIEDYWGNRRWWIDGCFYDSNRNILIGKSNFNDTGSRYENFGQASASNQSGYINKIQGTNNTGFIPASTGGSATTYYCDYGSLYGDSLPDFGGMSYDGDVVGGFCLHSNPASASYAVIGGRLFYSNGNDKIYIGAYLGVNQSSKLRSVSGQTSHNNATIGAFRTLAKANNN